MLLNEINQVYKGKAIYTETRNFNDYGSYKKVFGEYGWIYKSYLNFRLDCRTKKIAWNQLDKNRKRQISKAFKIGVKIKEADSEEVTKFYAILSDLYINKIKKPLFELEFFKAFFQLNLGKFFLVIYNNIIIGGIMCPVLEGKSLYEFYVCGLDQEFKEACPERYGYICSNRVWL